MGVACLKLEEAHEAAGVRGGHHLHLPAAAGKSAAPLVRSSGSWSWPSAAAASPTDTIWAGRAADVRHLPENVPEPKELFAEARTLYEKEDRRTVAVDMDCVCRAGEPVRLTVRAGGSAGGGDRPRAGDRPKPGADGGGAAGPSEKDRRHRLPLPGGCG